MRRTDDDDEFLVETVRRACLLGALRENPESASELEDDLALSRSTIHRATKTLMEEDLVEKSDGKFSLTPFGEVIASETVSFNERVHSARRLKPFLNSDRSEDVPLEHFADARVACPKARQPHYPIKRIIEFIESAETMSIFSSVISPFYVDVAYREMLAGTDIEVVFDEQVIGIVLEEYDEKAKRALETGRFDVRVCRDVPFELFLSETRVGMAVHEKGIAQVFVETDDPAALAWGESLYDRYRDESEPIAVSAESGDGGRQRGSGRKQASER